MRTSCCCRTPIGSSTCLVEAKAAGLTEHIGVSVYSPAKLQAIAERYDIDFFQAPANVFDRRFLSSDIAELVASRGLEFHARSIFLQGILAGTTQSLPKYFSQWDHLLSSFHQTCDQHRLDEIPQPYSLSRHIRMLTGLSLA